ncbi:MAG: hypothetical protein QOF18_1711 [Frankiaceae bacterium]|nr:hypothetical protein [Frankiaceae bacterium]
MPRRTPLLVTVALAATALVAPALASTSSTPLVRVLHGSNPQVTAVFPSNRFTVADSRQVTGRRVHLPVPSCTHATYSICDGVKLLNTLDGFDIQPRVYVPFSGPINVKTVTPKTVFVTGPDGRAGIYEIVLDPLTHILEGTVDRQLAEDTRYTLVVTRGVHDTHGRSIAHAVRVRFTTETATRQLDHIRRSLDSGRAYRQAGISPSQRGLSFKQGKLTTVFAGSTVVHEGIYRNDQTSAKQGAPLTSSLVPNLVDPGTVGWYAFGSYLSPQFVTHDAVIPSVPTRRTPPALRAARLGFAMLLPSGSPPAGGWPVAVYGPGFTRSYFDLYVTADHNAGLGIATIAIDPLGHGFGPKSTITINHGTPAAVSFRSFGRGSDRDGDGKILESEGVQPTDHKVFSGGKMVADRPSHQSLVGLRDGLIQTTSDVMTVVRAVERGVSVPTTTGNVALAKTKVEYYGLSFGGIYGTMLMGTDPHVKVGFLNSGGGPILDIARESGFRDLLAANFKITHPNLLNGGPGLNGFTESQPDPTDGPNTKPVRGSFRIRQTLSDGNWMERSGSPESFAPLIRLHPRYAAKTVEFLNAYGDATVPNITLGNIMRAGHLFDRLTFYRNDKSPTSGSDPHGFMADPTLAGRSGAEQELATFLQSYGMTVIDPDGPDGMFEVPIANRNELECLHYAEPQSGHPAYPPAAAGTCGKVRHS